MSRPLKDRENSKFDSQDRVKVSVEEDNSSTKNVKVTNTSSDSIPVTLTNSDSSSDLDVTVKNTDSDAVPVKIINTDANIDVEVSIPGTVEINDSTPVDVNITNSSLSTFAIVGNTIDANLTDLNSLNRLPVSVDNIPTVTVSGTLPTTFTNTDIRTRKHYSASDITALGSSTDVTAWASALADGVLTKEFVDSYQSEFEQVTLHTHPNLGDGNKALKKIVQYSTQNNATVIESIDYSVVDWNKDSSIEGSVSISAGAITSPDPSGAIAMHTVVTTLTVTDNTLGGVTLSLSGTNASLYHIHEVETGTHSQTSLAYVAGRTYQIHAHSGFPTQTSYSHSITVTATGDVFGISDSVNIATSATYTAPASYTNLKYSIGSTQSSSTHVDYQLNGTNKNVFSTNSANMPGLTDAISISGYIDWTSVAAGSNKYNTFFSIFCDLPSTGKGLQLAFYRSTGSSNYYNLRIGVSDGSKYWYRDVVIGTPTGNFGHFVVTKSTSLPDSTTDPFKVYVDNSEKTTKGSILTSGALTSTAWDSQAVDEVHIGGYHKYFVATGTLGRNTSAAIRYDEFSFFNKELSSSEINTLYNTNGTPFDLTTLTGYNLTAYFRHGDGDNDDEANERFYDTVGDTNRYFEGSSATIENLSLNDEIYEPGAFNDYYVTKDGSALNTNKVGIDSNADISNPLSSSWSISFWFKSATDQSSSSITGGNYQYDYCLITNDSLGTSDNGSVWWSGFNLQVRGTDLVVNYHAGGNDFYQYKDTGINATLFDNQWHNVIVVHSGTTNSTSTWNQNCKVYVDLVEMGVSTTYGNGTPGDATTTTPFFGKGVASGHSNINGHITGMKDYYDECAVWTTTALDSTARTNIYNNGSPTDLTSTTGVASPSKYYRFENVDVGYETIADSATSNEHNVVRVSY